MKRPQIAMYGGACCGGCDISLLEVGAHIIDLARVADIAFWPCVADYKYSNVAAYPDEHIDICLFNGGVRNSEQEQVARLLRRKSRLLVAYGACATSGGIPALANLASTHAIYDAIYHHNASIDNAQRVEPQPEHETSAGELDLPRFYPAVLRLQDVVPIDFELPGCPPQAGQVLEVVQSLLAAAPARGHGASLVGCTDKSVCEECPRQKSLVKIQRLRRIHQFRPEPDQCLLEQGIICMGPATRGGCGALCLKAGMPCEGCYGCSGDAQDQGAAMIGALGSLVDASTEVRAAELVASVPDPTGSFYRFSMSSGALKALNSSPGGPR